MPSVRQAHLPKAAKLTGHRSTLAIPAELQLLINCCKLNFRRTLDDGLRDLADLNWARFGSLAAFHRVQGLAWNALYPARGALPADVSHELESAALSIASRNLATVRECQALRGRFEDSKISMLFLKGLTLGVLAYRRPFAKSSIDIDILVDPRDVQSAADLLRASGYRLIVPEHVPLDDWHKRSKESVWTKDSADLQLDLHTRTADSQRLIPLIDVHSPRQTVSIAPGIDLPTFAPDELFAYLTVHGASSLWFRLKWAADLAALLHSQPGAELERLYARSQQLGAGRAAGQALLVADLLFGTLDGCAKLRDELMRDRAIRELTRMAVNCLTREPVEPTASLLGTLPIHLAQFFLLPGFSYQFAELSGQARRFRWRERS